MGQNSFRGLFRIILDLQASTVWREFVLVGAALSSFTKKCERDAATVSCASAGSDRKLRGAAKNSFTKKCIKDATNKD